jgi:hypothetical protein
MRPNTYGGYCGDCGCYVEPHRGYLAGRSDSGRWQILCARCESAQETKGSRQHFTSSPEAPRDTLLDYAQSDPVIQRRLELIRRQLPAIVAIRVLGLRPPVELDQVKNAYRRLALEHHPDHGGKASDFRAVESAYRQVLKVVDQGLLS